MTLHPNCKINIGLQVISKREDGYHNLETIFYPIFALHDDLEIELSDTFVFEQEGITIDCKTENNLIVRCFQLMRQHFPQIGNVHIRFRKNIPFGAGLGGGSSDAAHTAMAINTLFHLHLTRQQLAELIRPLGADCPFFLYNTPCYAEGIGDKLTPISLNLKGLKIILIKPEVAISTKEAYSGITPHPEATHSILNAIQENRSLEHLQNLLVNDFEHTIFPIHPELASIKQALLDAGAIYASMSGSGSTIFALFSPMPNSTTQQIPPKSSYQSILKKFSSNIILNTLL